ncbi:MAG: RND family efflux transporter MFP subunit [Verrucomicrobiales bacterium]|jgi:RND family efflux transporter MFP subunit
MKFKTQGKIAIATITLAIAGAIIAILIKFAPEAKEEKREEILPTVEVIAVEATSTSIQIDSQGLIEAPTETSLAAEVGGTVIEVSEKFEVGGEFQRSKWLLKIEPADYASALAQMQANVAEAELNLSLEQGRARAAERDWKSVGDNKAPSDLVLRKLHIKSAKAKLESAKSAVEKANRDLARTEILAPYDCRIRATYAEVGSFVTPGARIADIYERGGFEVRLPIPLDDFAFIEEDGTGSPVTFTAEIAGNVKTWRGKIIRDEGVIDRQSRSVYLVAHVDTKEQGKFLSPGLFVKATIIGRELENIIALPRKALYGKDQVYIIDNENKLNFRTVTVARTERDRVLITDGLKSGERVCITNLAAAIDQMKVKILGDEADKTEVEEPEPDAKPEA